MGALHLQYPQYNAVTVRDLIAAATPDALALVPLTAGALDNPAWQDTPEIALPLAVVPWAKQQGLPVYCVAEASPDPDAYADFQRYLNEYPQAAAQLQEVDALLPPLQAILSEPLTLIRIRNEVLPVIGNYWQARDAQLGDGPGTDWLKSRSECVAQHIADVFVNNASVTHVVVLASSDQVPFLEIALEQQGVNWLEPPQAPVSDAAQTRAFLDFSFRGELSEPGNAILRLQDIGTPEARYHEGNIRFAYGQLEEAKACLEIASRDNFSQPYFLPGYLLARLGQLHDLLGDRDAAKRAYKGVRALSYAPQDALDVAHAGLERPFTLPK
jgi:tetratricopeptide (TPR) repeat protein